MHDYDYCTLVLLPLPLSIYWKRQVRGLRRSCRFTTRLQCHGLHHLHHCSLPGLAWLMTGQRHGDWWQPRVVSAVGMSHGL